MSKLICAIFIFLSFAFLAFPTMAYDPLTVENNIYGIGIINHSDLIDVKNLVNSNEGDWGYVTIIKVITEKSKLTEELKKKEINRFGRNSLMIAENIT